MVGIKHVVAWCVLVIGLASCRFKDNDFNDRACTLDTECNPDQACIPGPCTTKNCNDKSQCGTDNTFECKDGKCVATTCTADTDCEIGFACEGGFCHLACADHDRDGAGYGTPCTGVQDCDDNDP